MARGLVTSCPVGFISVIGQSGTYTRIVGLDRETNKALLLKHIKRHAASGATMSDPVLPSLTRSQIQVLLRELVDGKDVHVCGVTRTRTGIQGLSPAPIAIQRAIPRVRRMSQLPQDPNLEYLTASSFAFQLCN